MKTNRLIIYLVLVVLMLQPIAAIMTVPFTTSDPVFSRTTAIPAQDYGSRLEPDEYTKHVPVLIEGTSDFDSQGWLGSGTVGDPYIIEGLNITSDVGQVSIRIINTDAHFVVRDCLLGQMSNIRAIELVNTSHGTIEYTSIDSEGGGIYLENANETLVSHANSTVNDDYSIHIIKSHDSSVLSSWCLADSYRSIEITGSKHVELVDTVFRNPPGYYGIRILNSNHTSLAGCSIYEAYYGVMAIGSKNVSVYDMTIMADDIGVYFDECNDSIVVDSHIETIDSAYVSYINDCQNTHVNNTYFSTDLGSGVYIYSSNDTVFYNNMVNGTASYGAHFESFYNLFVDLCTFMDVSVNGIEVVDVQEPIIINNEFIEIGGHGCYVNPSHNGDFTGNSLQKIGGYGFYMTGSENWTVSGNTVFESGLTGLHITGGINVHIHDNSIETTGTNGIYVDANDDCEIINNEVSEISQYGIYVQFGNRAMIWNNSVTDSGQGIYLHNSINSTVSSNNVDTVKTVGIYLNLLSNAEIMNNTMTDCNQIGIAVQGVFNGTFMYNILESCGFFFSPGYTLQYYNHTLTGNLVNGESIYYELNAFGASISGNDYPQIILVNSSDATVTGSMFGSVSAPVQVFYSDRVDVVGVTSIDNYYAITIYASENCTLSDSSTKGSSDGSVGVFVDSSDRFHVWNSTFDGHSGTSGYGMNIRYTLLALIENCTLENNWIGINSYISDNTTIYDVSIWHSEYSAFVADAGSFNSFNHFRLEDCFVYNASRGLYITNSEYGVVMDSEFHHCEYGIYAEDFFGSSDDWHVNESIIRSCGVGIYLHEESFFGSNPEFWHIHNNTILYSENYGVQLMGVASTTISYNIIAVSRTDNGFDDTFMYWDDNVDTGNWWDDWDGIGSYDLIDGAGNSEDRYPMLFEPTEPIINRPMDVWYAEGSEGNEIVWYPYDDSLKNWTCSIDGTEVAADAWNFDNITVNIDGLSYGDHVVHLIVFDVDQNSISDTVLVHVYDDTPPTLDTPPNRLAFVDATDQVIVWEAFDLHPEDYSVYDGEDEFANGTWTSGEVEVNIDSLAVGKHVIVLEVRDIDGNSERDTVIVTVIDDDTAPTIDSPADITYLVGAEENRITWTPSDEYPDRFVVTLNNSDYLVGDWGGSRIVINVDGLDPGTHTFEIEVFDASGNSVTDEVIVTVLGVQTTTPPPEPLDLQLLLLIGGVALAVVVVIGVVFYIRKRRA